MSYLSKLVKMWRGDPRDPRVTYAAPEQTREGGVVVGHPAAEQPNSTFTHQISTEMQLQLDKEQLEAQKRAEEDEVMMALALSSSERQAESDEQVQLEAAIAICPPLQTMAEARAEKLSLKYWKSGNLDRDDQLCDGFYDINGEFPELGSDDVFPDLMFLKHFEPEMSDTREVIQGPPSETLTLFCLVHTRLSSLLFTSVAFVGVGCHCQLGHRSRPAEGGEARHGCLLCCVPPGHGCGGAGSGASGGKPHGGV